MGWKNLGEPVIDTPWFQPNLANVELPGGRRLDHHVLRLPPVVLAAVLDAEDRVLMQVGACGGQPAPSCPMRSRGA